MNYYICCFGVSCEPPGFDPLIDRYKGKFYELRSYWEYRKHKGCRIDIYGKGYFMDSGAFSARMKGVNIELEEYGDFISKYKNDIVYFANLDAIPKSGSPEDLALGAKQTWRNQKDLEKMTNSIPLPVFHKGEPLEYLERYLKEYEYICVGGLMNDSCKNHTFFDLIWSMNRKHGKPWRKIHAFGLSNIHYLKRYPWHSADSSSWLRSATCGVILVPVEGKNHEYDFLQRPSIIPISEKAFAKGSCKKRYFDYHPKEMRNYIEGYIESLGLTLEDMRGKNLGRMIININFWVQFEKSYNLKIQPRDTKQMYLIG